MVSGFAKSRRASVVPGAVALLILGATGFAQAQSFNDAMQNALSFQCRGLQGPSGNYSSSLDSICTAIPSVQGSNSGGSIASQGATGAGAETRRILLRLEETRQDARRDLGVRSASADEALQQGRLGTFLTTEFEWINKTQSPNEPAFDSLSRGVIAGVDYAFLPWLTAGGAIHYSRLTGDFGGDGGHFTTDAIGFTLYGSATPMPNLFIDATVGYIHREYEITRRATFIAPNGTVVDGFADGNTAGNEFNMGALAGYDFVFKALTIGPRFGVNYTTNNIGGYSEVGQQSKPDFDTGLELSYDGQHRDSLVTKLGFFASYALSAGIGVLVPQVGAEWVHEYLDDQRVIYFRFREDELGAKLRFQTDKPDRNYFHVNAGLVMVFPKDVSAFLSYQVLLGYNDRIAHTLNAGLRIGF